MGGTERCSLRPVVVSLPPSDRGTLEAAAQRGLVAVRYSGCELRILSGCVAPGRYAYTAFAPKSEELRIRQGDELAAELPLGAASLAAELAQAGELRIHMTMVGTYDADRTDASVDSTQGTCAGATHLVRGFTVGAFEIVTGAEARIGGQASIPNAGAGASSRSAQTSHKTDGDARACVAGSPQDANPPPGCTAVLRIDVVPLGAFVPATASLGGAGEPPKARDTRPDRAALTPRAGETGAAYAARLHQTQVWHVHEVPYDRPAFLGVRVTGRSKFAIRGKVVAVDGAGSRDPDITIEVLQISRHWEGNWGLPGVRETNIASLPLQDDKDPTFFWPSPLPGGKTLSVGDRFTVKVSTLYPYVPF